MIRPQAADFRGELLAHAQARLVHRHVFDHRIGPREIDVFEDARRVRVAVGAMARMQLPSGVSSTASPGATSRSTLETEDVERDRFGGDRIFLARRRLALAEHERTDAVRIAEREHAVVEHQRDHRIAAARARMHARDGLEDVIGREVMAILDLQLVREDVQQHFGIRIGVDVAAIVFVHFAAQRIGVDQVAVVRRARCRTASSRRTAAPRPSLRNRRSDSGNGRCRRCRAA